MGSLIPQSQFYTVVHLFISKKGKKRKTETGKFPSQLNIGGPQLTDHGGISSHFSVLLSFILCICHLSFLKDHCCYSSLRVSSPVIFLKCVIIVKSCIVLQSVLPALSLSTSKSHSRSGKERSDWPWLAIIMCTIPHPQPRVPQKGWYPLMLLKSSREIKATISNPVFITRSPLISVGKGIAHQGRIAFRKYDLIHTAE